MKAWEEMIVEAVKRNEMTEAIEVKHSVPDGDSFFTVQYILEGKYAMSCTVVCDDDGAEVIGEADPMNITPVGW